MSQRPFNMQFYRGFTLIVGMMLLIMVSLAVVSAYNMSSTNLKLVGNMQFRDEALASADFAIEQQVGNLLADTDGDGAVDIAPPVAAQNLDVRIANDDTSPADYLVTVNPPVCVQANTATVDALSSVTLPAAMTAAEAWNTVWEITGTAVENRAGSGARVQVVHGVRVLLSSDDRNLYCP